MPGMRSKAQNFVMIKKRQIKVQGKEKIGEVEVEEEERMPATVWFSLKKSLQCKSVPSEVHDPQGRNCHLGSILTRKTSRSGCSRSIANLKDVIHGSKRHLDKPRTCSPRSIGSSEFQNPITHEVILSNSTCELRITGVGAGLGSAFVGTIRPGTPGPGGQCAFQYSQSHRDSSNTSSGKSPGLCPDKDRCGIGNSPLRAGGGSSLNHAGSIRRPCNGTAMQKDEPCAIVTCHKCGEQFIKWEALEAHHLSKHAVTELVEGDSSRKIVEIICKASWLKSENNCGRIERILKVHNMQKTVAGFEEHREVVKTKASKLVKKHPRCLADGNELLRFYGTTIACALGINGSSNLCTSEKCNVCEIIRHGFSTKKEGSIGIFTTSTSGKALESVEMSKDDPLIRKALIICRVIAGRVHKALDNYQELASQPGFDSVAGKVGVYANIEELYLLNARALLPCFVVICKN